jgi:hypothetical protein
MFTLWIINHKANAERVFTPYETADVYAYFMHVPHDLHFWTPRSSATRVKAQQ